MNKNIKMHPSWLDKLKNEFEMDYMQQLRSFLKKELISQQLFPKMEEVFRAFELTPFDRVKVVLLGQDPYHNLGQAHGLCFSVKNRPPPSLVNIFKEIKADLNIDNKSGDLTAWAEQGVFLLNSVLTVRAHQAASHRNQGWEQFTDRVIGFISDELRGVVFLLWGSYAQQKISLINSQKHLILKSPHPSPLSAHRGFFGCRHFSKSNSYLEANGNTPINWNT